MSESETLRIRTAVDPVVMRKALFRGTFLAGAGVLLLAAAGTYMPPPMLKIWGIPIIAVGVALIAWGLIPYRRMTRLEGHPDEIVVIEESYLQYLSRGKRVMTIPVVSIEKIAHISKKGEYGIGIWLKQPLPEKIIVHKKGLNLRRLLADSQKKFGCHLMLPFFTNRGYSSLAFLELSR